jgi:predicted ester cyclase
MTTPLRRIFDELWNGKNRAVIDEVMSPEYIHHDVLYPDSGIDGYKQFVEQYLTAFPDIRITIHDEIVAGDAIVARWTATGTQNGDLLKPGTACR